MRRVGVFLSLIHIFPKRKMPEMLDIPSLSDICGDLKR